LVTLNSDSCVPGSEPERATAQAVPFVSISFAGTGVNAGLPLLIFKGATSLNLNVDAAGHEVPAGGFETGARSDPRNDIWLLKRFVPITSKNLLSPSFGKSGRVEPKLMKYLQKSAALVGEAVLLNPKATELLAELATSSAA